MATAYTSQNSTGKKEEWLREFYDNLRSFTKRPPQLIIKFKKNSHNIECMMAENLQDGLPSQLFPDAPEKRAHEFLCRLADLLEIDERFLRRHLFFFSFR
jgi:hypothetical protein